VKDAAIALPHIVESSTAHAVNWSITTAAMECDLDMLKTRDSVQADTSVNLQTRGSELAHCM